MSSEAIITVENLGKRYRLGAGRANERYTALRDVIADSISAPFRRLRNGRRSKIENGSLAPSTNFHLPTSIYQLPSTPASQDFWALKGVSFEVKQGEVVGIIGRNGAGKSTLLKILSRITEPTEGRIHIKGRVASLLEVGTGFHPELTGRENIYLNGAILGMHRHEIKAKFDEIVAFAEVEKFLDTPVKRYSSGMYVRLAFAVAAHLEPEILIVDEVLAVGDAEFQKKCLGKMRDVAQGEGRTVLFVSHNMAAVRSLCSVGVLLDNGHVTFIGATADAVVQYATERNVDSTTYVKDTLAGTVPQFLEVKINTASQSHKHDVNEPLTIDVTYHNLGFSDLLIGLHVYNLSDVSVIHSSSELISRVEGGPVSRVTAVIPGKLLNVGRYRCALVLARRNVAIYDQINDELGFEIENPNFAIALTGPNEWNGILAPESIQWIGK
jgi:lipopolysaccharide transport system ATP-binding protein